MSTFPATRLRRLRRTAPPRSLVRETTLDLDDFVMPLFVGPDTRANEELPPMGRFSVADLSREVEELVRLGVGAVILFGIPDDKDEVGSSAWDPSGPVPLALEAVAGAAPELVRWADVCLCEYTTHGHCGPLRGDVVDNDAALPLLARAAVAYAEAGADIIAPSDMMDGRVASIREALDSAGHMDSVICSYAVKYASGYYGPFRDAAGSTPAFGDRRSHQMDPANAREALREVALDLAEGADMVMVKPAGPYLDIVRSVAESVEVPVAAYQVSGEFAMVEAAAARGWIERERVMMEALTGIARAGAGLILTYFAVEAARLTEEQG